MRTLKVRTRQSASNPNRDLDQRTAQITSYVSTVSTPSTSLAVVDVGGAQESGKTGREAARLTRSITAARARDDRRRRRSGHLASRPEETGGPHGRPRPRQQSDNEWRYGPPDAAARRNPISTGRCRYGRRRRCALVALAAVGRRTAHRGQSVSLAPVSPSLSPLFPTGAASVFLLSPRLPCPRHICCINPVCSPRLCACHDGCSVLPPVQCSRPARRTISVTAR